MPPLEALQEELRRVLLRRARLFEAIRWLRGNDRFAEQVTAVELRIARIDLLAARLEQKIAGPR